MANFSGTCLFVVGDAASLTVPDGNLKDRLETNGWTVTAKSDEDAFLDTDANWETFDVAVVAESSSSTTLGTSGRDAVVGVIMLEGGSVDDWDLATSAAAGRDATQIKIHTNDEVAAGLAGSGSPATEEVAVATTTKDMRGLTDESSGAVAVVISANSVNEELLVRWELGATLTTGTAADRRVWIGWFREDTPDPPNEDVVGFVINDTGYAIFDASVEWAAGNDITTDRQLGVPVADLVTTGWTKDDATNYFEDVNDGKVPDSATTAVTSPDNPSSSVISFDLTSLTDPTNNILHTVAIGWRRVGGTRALTLDTQLRQGYVNESTLGTLIATTGAEDADSQFEWGGTILQLTTTEADNITDYTDLQIRFVADTSGGGSTANADITSVRLLIDGGADAAVVLTSVLEAGAETTGTASQLHEQSATVEAGAEATGIATQTHEQAATLEAAAEASGTATQTHEATATLESAAELSAAATQTHEATATLEAAAEVAGTLSVSGVVELTGTIEAAAETVGAPSQIHTPTATLEAAAEATATATQTHEATAILEAAAEVSGAPSVLGIVELTGTVEAVAETDGSLTQLHTPTSTVEAASETSGVADQVHEAAASPEAAAETTATIENVVHLTGTIEAGVESSGRLTQTHFVTATLEAAYETSATADQIHAATAVLEAAAEVVGNASIVALTSKGFVAMTDETVTGVAVTDELVSGVAMTEESKTSLVMSDV